MLRDVESLSPRPAAAAAAAAATGSSVRGEATQPADDRTQLAHAVRYLLRAIGAAAASAHAAAAAAGRDPAAVSLPPPLPAADAAITTPRVPPKALLSKLTNRLLAKMVRAQAALDGAAAGLSAALVRDLPVIFSPRSSFTRIDLARSQNDLAPISP